MDDKEKCSEKLKPRVIRLLETIEKTGSLNAACKKLKTSYRYEWGELKKAKENLGQPLVMSNTGGQKGGQTILTAFGKKILTQNKLRNNAMETLTKNEDFWQVMSTKLSARNQIPGKIKEIKKDGVAAKIIIEVTEPITVTSVITSDAADFLELKKGMEVKAVVKATEVMISI